MVSPDRSPVETTFGWRSFNQLSPEKRLSCDQKETSITIKGPLADCILGFGVGHGDNVLPGTSLVLTRLVVDPLRFIQP